MSKKIILDCYTDKTFVKEYADIDNSNKFLPEWWKELKPTVESDYKGLEMPTMKTCDGFVSQYKAGVIMPLWSDFAMQVSAEGTFGYSWVFSDEASSAEEHPGKQRGLYLPEPRYQHIKLIAPWVIVCKEDVNWQLLGATWNFNRPEEFVIPPGIVNFKYQFGANINMFVKKEKEQRIVRLDHGQPLIQLIPLSDRPVELRTHLISTEKFIQMSGLKTNIKFSGTYRRVKELLKGRCPFGG